MKTLRNLTLSLAVAVSGIAMAAKENAPDILIPNVQGAGVIKGLSNNGKYGVASIKPGDDGFSYTVGSVFYDLTGSVPVGTNIGKGRSASAANDVTDDGKLVVGSVDRMPAVCRYKDGEWVWEKLPVPDKVYDVPMEDMYTGEQYVSRFKLNGGHVNAVTPDGKYGVGLCRSNENEMIELAVMWDLTTMQIVEVDFPVTNLFGEDELQSRFLQISDDGRYILCWNSFSYIGGVVFVFDREKNEAIYIDVDEVGGKFVPREPGYIGLELDGITKSLTSDGHYVGGGIMKDDETYVFRFDVWNKELHIYKDAVYRDATGWSVTKDGLVLGGTPARTPYAEGLICTEDMIYPFQALYRDAYGLDMYSYGIDVTGKPNLVSDDGRTIVFVTSKDDTYVARFKEPLRDGVDRINMMSNWTVTPAKNTKMTKLQNVTFTFDNPIEVDGKRYEDVKLLDSKGNVIATALENGLNASDAKLEVSFKPVLLEEGETYTLTIPEGLCWLKGHNNSKNNAIEVKYVGRENVPVSIKNISPESGSTLNSLDLNDNPVVVQFDVPVKVNGTANDRPMAHLYIDDSNEPIASLVLDIDLYTHNLVIYPSSTFYLYKGSEYKIEVPEGAVTDLSGMGPSGAFSIEYEGSYVPQMGDDLYLFKSNCNNFDNFLFYEGDHGTPVSEYANMGFTADETPWWVVMDDNSLTVDMSFASHSCYTDGRQADDWVATRQLSIPEDVPTYLQFQSQSYRKNKEDRLKVYVYVNDASYNALTASVVKDIKEKGELIYNEIQSPGKYEDVLADDWTNNVIPLDKYKGKKIYICFVNDNQNQSMVIIDDIQVVKEVNSFITITGSENVVNQQSVAIRGILSIASELADYNTLTMTLLDSEGKEVSAYSATGLNLKGGDTYNFEFPQQLPLVLGEENHYSIKYTLDEDTGVYDGVIRDLTFQPEKRVIVEEYTGKTCQYCPLGMAAMERLEAMYGDKIIPIGLYSYNGDPKGFGISSYSATVFNGSGAAPMGRINRRPDIVSPMYSDENNKYHMTAADVPGTANVWQDEVVDEMNNPTYLSVDAEARIDRTGYVYVSADVKTAINLNNQNVRVLGVLLEDGIQDSQSSGVYMFDDPILGEFGLGGRYSLATFWYEFNNVARGYWGQSPNGTPRLVPAVLKIGETYNVEFEYKIPDIVANKEKLKMAIVLLDESTGRVINATVAKVDTSGVEEIIDNAGGTLDVNKVGNEIYVSAAGDVQVAVYTLDGRMIKNVNGTGNLSISLDGYHGVVIVRAASGGMSVVKKIIL